MSCDNPILAEMFDGRMHIYGHFTDYQSVYQKFRLRDWYLLPCGKCLSCLAHRAKEWVLRCKHELRDHESSCFVTLTYRDSCLPPGGVLHRPDLQNFLKRLRKAIDPVKIRFFGCGEYGKEHLRPHYHLILFGWCPGDLVPWSIGRDVLYRSPLLEKLWPCGFVSVGSVSDDSIAYCARYSLKKLDLDYGDLPRPFLCCSNRPGIGSNFFDKFSPEALVKSRDGDILRHGFHISGSSSCLMPRYYMKLLERKNTDDFESLRQFRRRLAIAENLTAEDCLRAEEFSRYRRAHNSHYVDVITPDGPMENENE